MNQLSKMWLIDKDITMRCKLCNGMKKRAPLGFMEVNCEECGGIGYIVQSVNVDALDIDSKAAKSVPKRAYVRKPISNSVVDKLKRSIAIVDTNKSSVAETSSVASAGL